MAVVDGGLLDGGVVPGTSRVVAPGLHAGEHVVRISGAVQHPVHKDHDLGAVDGIVGAEAVAVALDPPGLDGEADLLGGPVTGRVGEVAGAVVGHVIADEPGGDGGKLGAGDGRVGLHAAVGIALEDPGRSGCGNCGAVPCVRLRVSEAVGGGPVGHAVLLRHQAEEDGGHLGAGDVVHGTHRAVGITGDIREVLRVVQPRHIGQRDLVIRNGRAGVTRRRVVGDGCGSRRRRGSGGRRGDHRSRQLGDGPGLRALADVAGTGLHAGSCGGGWGGHYPCAPGMGGRRISCLADGADVPVVRPVSGPRLGEGVACGEGVPGLGRVTDGAGMGLHAAFGAGGRGGHSPVAIGMGHVELIGGDQALLYCGVCHIPLNTVIFAPAVLGTAIPEPASNGLTV